MYACFSVKLYVKDYSCSKKLQMVKYMCKNSEIKFLLYVWKLFFLGHLTLNKKHKSFHVINKKIKCPQPQIVHFSTNFSNGHKVTYRCRHKNHESHLFHQVTNTQSRCFNFNANTDPICDCSKFSGFFFIKSKRL